ncbi:hypothetical protein [Butyrivibrio sp. AE2032]|uniref:hypothetical protein n=1 Tax=Butyrivibrio sp. AE2032 TaxID=1458463 RepID=UPI000551D31C|nr:hypothetical protein [Butyrivibrio sp. AE2032]
MKRTRFINEIARRVAVLAAVIALAFAAPLTVSASELNKYDAQTITTTNIEEGEAVKAAEPETPPAHKPLWILLAMLAAVGASIEVIDLNRNKE